MQLDPTGKVQLRSAVQLDPTGRVQLRTGRVQLRSAVQLDPTGKVLAARGLLCHPSFVLSLPLQANFLSIKAKFFAHGLKDVSEITDIYRVMQVLAMSIDPLTL